MKIILFAFILFLSNIFGQGLINSIVKELNKVPGLNVIKSNDYLSYKINGIEAQRFYYRNEEIKYNDSVPEFYFDINSLDTAIYNYKYNLFQELPISSGSFYPLLADVNDNNKIEIYGYKGTMYDDSLVIYEQGDNKKFYQIYAFPYKTKVARNIYDIDRDGEPELQALSLFTDSINHWDQDFFKKPNQFSLPTDSFFTYKLYEGMNGLYSQLNDFTFGDFDNDDTTEAIFFSFSPFRLFIIKYNSMKRSLDSIYVTPILDEYISGFIVGDFDQNGKTDIIYGGAEGNITVMECEGYNNYKIAWRGNSGISNSFYHAKTNDINNNGKPEFWIGGDDNTNTVITGYESDGNNSYHPIARIIFPGLAAFGISGGAIDVDNDGKDELFIRLGGILLVIKFVGTAESPDFKIYYYKSFTDFIENVNFYKLQGEDYPALIVSARKVVGSGAQDVTYIFRNYNLDAINVESNNNVNFTLSNNYPNPFNPTTTINYSLAKEGNVKINVYNILGGKVAAIVNENKQAGNYSVQFNAADLPSGIYFYKLEAGQFSQVKKMMLLK